MNGNNEDAKLLASLTVFRELYNKKEDIYSILSRLIDYVIYDTKKYSFSLPEITGIINDTFEFDLLDSVVSTAIGRLDYITKKNQVYSVDWTKRIDSKDISSLESRVKNENQYIFDLLYSFAEEKEKTKLTKNDKNKLVSAFCSFLLDESVEADYSSLISAFIIINRNDERFITIINKVREGVILYSGLKYNSNVSEVGSWKNELTLYLDTEIVFHLAGYNGKVFQKLFNDFNNYVKEINSKNAQVRPIRLKYFPQVAIEINSYFHKAKCILEGKEQLNPDKTAMVYLVNGCKDIAKLAEKNADLFSLLKTMGIEEEPIDLFENESNFEYNIISNDVYNDISFRLGFDVRENIKFLNYISILRNKTESYNFYTMKAVLLTGNSKTIQVAWDESIKKENVVPLAITLHWITNKLWFKLNKGFGDGELPKTFDVITKAQISLSHILNESIGLKYKEAVDEFKDGTITEDVAKARIVHLKKNVRKPEDIVAEDASQVLDILNADSLEKFAYEQEQFKSDAKKKAAENEMLKERAKEQEKQNKDNEKKLTLKNIEIELTTKNQLLSDKKKIKSILDVQFDSIIEKSKNKFLFRKIIFSIIVLGYYAALYYFIYQFSWNILEPITYVLGTIPFILSLLYIILFEKEINPLKAIKQIQNKMIDQRMSEYKFDNVFFDNLKEEIDGLNVEIEILVKKKEDF